MLTRQPALVKGHHRQKAAPDLHKQAIEAKLEEQRALIGLYLSEMETIKELRTWVTVGDEGRTPVRYPSIIANQTPKPDATMTFTVDLKRLPDIYTQGAPVTLASLPTDWTSLELSVTLLCPHIDFENDGVGTVTIQRNRESLPANITGTLRPNVPVGQVLKVAAIFFLGTRFCGSALRLMTVTHAVDFVSGAGPTARTITYGTVVAEPMAEPPDLTVRISNVSDAPGKLDWLVTTSRFDGLPPKLRAQIDLGRAVSDETHALFAEYAALKRGEHRKRIEGFGNRLWQSAPQMFRDVYWALWDKYQRPLTIQFISDELHLPWELMRPVRSDESDVHPPLAVKHAVARWIERWDGYMRNQLPRGEIVTITPEYGMPSLHLPRAQNEAKELIERFGARRVQGTRKAVAALLENMPPTAPVAVLHFAGHGVFVRTATTESGIILEDGVLSSSEVERPEVRLGKACRTLVFLNACDAGVTGSIFGEIGGWADALLSRQFGGFIAPLWSVDDEDAGVIAVEVIEGIFARHEPIAAVLRSVRENHGDASPTFYSYLYYGDVTARLAA